MKFPEHGIKVEGVSFDLATMMARKDKIVDNVHGRHRDACSARTRSHRCPATAASRPPARTTASKCATATRAARSKRATSSSPPARLPASCPGAPVDNDLIVDNIGALSFTEVPKRLGVIGAGVIGLEMGSVWKRLGSDVNILEALPAFLPAADEQVSKEAFRVFNGAQDLKIYTGVKITGVKTGQEERDGDVHRQGRQHQSGRVRQADRRDRARAQYRRSRCRRRSASRSTRAASSKSTSAIARNLPNVYAIGDVVRGPMLAHKSSEEGVAVAETIAGQDSHVNLDTVPWVIYTSPEIAWVGKTEQQLKAEGVQYRAGHFPFIVERACARAGRDRRLRQDACRLRTPTASSACTSSALTPPS